MFVVLVEIIKYYFTALVYRALYNVCSQDIAIDLLNYLSGNIILEFDDFEDLQVIQDQAPHIAYVTYALYETSTL